MSNHNKETEARCFHCYRHYVEGTAAWALYMMRMGHKVTNPDDPRVYHLPEGGMIHVNGIKSIAGNQWIDYWCIDIPDGWQLYEPAEVVLNFGSGIKGTVRSCEHDGGCVRVISGDRVIAHIMTDVLEQPTRSLVEKLLKAQEEK